MARKPVFHQILRVQFLRSDAEQSDKCTKPYCSAGPYCQIATGWYLGDVVEVYSDASCAPSCIPQSPADGLYCRFSWSNSSKHTTAYNTLPSTWTMLARNSQSTGDGPVPFWWLRLVHASYCMKSKSVQCIA